MILKSDLIGSFCGHAFVSICYNMETTTKSILPYSGGTKSGKRNSIDTFFRKSKIKEIFFRFHQIKEIQLVREKTAQGDSKLKQIHIIIDIWESREVVPMARILSDMLRQGTFFTKELEGLRRHIPKKGGSLYTVGNRAQTLGEQDHRTQI